MIDILIGVDQAELHYSLQDVRGKPCEPIARLTPQGWTCVGGPKMSNGHAANFNAAFFVSSADRELNTTLQKFWEIESSGTEIKKPSYIFEEENAVQQVKESLTFDNGRYEVSIPWKPDRQNLPGNYEMALKRLENTEKRLVKNKEVRDGYIAKGYVSEVDSNSTSELNTWIHLDWTWTVGEGSENPTAKVTLRVNSKRWNAFFDILATFGQKNV